MNPNLKCSIAGITVEGLFGMYDYHLGSVAGQPFDPQLLLFYGDNGCGKTTILRLIYHSLSPESRRGHRTSLVRIPVRRFEVTLLDGTVIEVRRNQDSLVGPYVWRLTRPGEKSFELSVEPDAEGSVKIAPDSRIQMKWQTFEKELASLGLAIYFLPDDRRPIVPNPEDNRFDVDLYNFDSVASYELAKHRRKLPESLLQVTVSAVVNLLRTQVIAAAQVGEASINHIYSSVVRRMLWTKGLDVSNTVSSSDVSAALKSLSARSEPFAASGLMPKLEFTDLLEKIGEAEPTTKALVARVLQPYTDSITARLDALASIQKLIEALVSLLDQFYSGKQASFDMKDGLQIWQRNGQLLPLDALSSGEKQLLLLFCSTIRARAQATIFLIDEPELSLNVKWQRQLLESLLTLVKGSGVQFAIATHSIEILAGQRESIVRLTSKANGDSTESWNDERSLS